MTMSDSPSEPMPSEDLRGRIATLEADLYALRRELAGELAPEARPQGPFGFLSCRLGGNDVGVVLNHLEEVVPVAHMAPLPESEPWVAGLLNLRGESIPVIDALARVERRERALALSDLIVICSPGGRRAGLIVQEVHDVHGTTSEEIRSAGELPHAPYLLGVVELADRSVQLLCLERLVGLSGLPEGDA